RCLVFVVGAAAPWGLTCLLMLVQGVFQPFWFWTFTYARAYTTEAGLAVGWTLFRTTAANQLRWLPLVWFLSLLGLSALAWDARTRSGARFLGLFAACSFAAICPGLLFRDHYWIMLAPAAALLAGAGATAVDRLAGRFSPLGTRAVPLVLAIAAIATSIYLER